MNLFDLGLQEETPIKRDPAELIQEIRLTPCPPCDLQKINPNRVGFLCRGALDAKLGALVDLPLEDDVMHKSAIQSFGRQEWLRWLKHLNLTEQDLFVTHTVQCMTRIKTETKIRKAGKFEIVTAVVKQPDTNDISACFYRRALPVLKSLPNLEILLALGATAIETILGVDYGQKTHEGNFYLTDRLPGILVFTLDHPREYEAGGLPKRGRINGFLNLLKHKYLHSGQAKKIFDYHHAARQQGIEADLNYQL